MLSMMIRLRNWAVEGATNLDKDDKLGIPKMIGYGFIGAIPEVIAIVGVVGAVIGTCFNFLKKKDS